MALDLTQEGKMIKVRWIIGLLLATLLAVTSCTPPDSLASDPVGQMAGLTELAKGKLATRLGVEPEQITVYSVGPLAFPAPRSDRSSPQPAGYVIKLGLNGTTYEYNAKRVGDLYLLWREL
jgi:hypothetical protein